MRRFSTFALATFMALLLALIIASPSFADCPTPDPLRDAAFLDGHPPTCPPRLSLHIPEGTHDTRTLPRTEIVISVGPEEGYESYLPPYVLVRRHRAPSGIEPTVHGLPAQQMGTTIAIGITIRR